MVFCDPRFGSRQKGQRASHAQVVKALVDLGVEVVHEQLEFGDFMIIGFGPDGPMKIGIELKTIEDFVSSMVSNRLAGHQIPGLVDPKNYGRAYLVLQGVSRMNRRTGLLEVPRGVTRGRVRWAPVHGPRPIYWSAVEKFITGIEEVGVRLRRSRSAYETARVIKDVLDGFWSKDYDEHESFNVHVRPAPMALVQENPIVRQVRETAATLPGIGWGRSKSVAEAFGSIENMAAASVSDWQRIEGFGPTLAQGAYKAIRARIPDASVSTRRVPTRAQSPARKFRHSRQGQSAGVDSSHRAQRGVSAARTSRRVPR